MPVGHVNYRRLLPFRCALPGTQIARKCLSQPVSICPPSELHRRRHPLTPRLACGKGSIERMLYQFLPAWVNNTHWFGRYIQFSVSSTSTNQFTVHSSSSPATCDVSCIRVLFRRFSTYRFTRPVETTERRVPTSRPVLPGCIIPLHVVDGPSLRLGPFPSSPSDP